MSNFKHKSSDRPLRGSVRINFYAAFAGLLFLILTLTAVSVYSVQQQSAYQDQLDTSSQAAINIEKANGLIFAVVMESRGIYMSSDAATVQRYSSALLRRNRELADVMDQWQRIVRADDLELFEAFKTRVSEFIRFRAELVRRATTISQEAGREWGDNEANRSVRSALNEDLAALGTVYFKRANVIARMGERMQLTKLLLVILGIGAVAITCVTAFLLKASVIAPLLDITAATDRIASGMVVMTIPHIARDDEIGKLADAVQQLQKVIRHNEDLLKNEIKTAREREIFKSNEAHFISAIDNMAQGLVMLDAHANVILMNESYRKMYKLPTNIMDTRCSLRDILAHRAEAGLFSGDPSAYVKTILTRIGLGKPSTSHVNLKDGRWIRVFEQPTADGGWVATHEDFTKQHQLERMLERIERLFGAVVENIDEAILAQDMGTKRYLFVNRAAEVLFGMSREAIMGRTAQEVFEDDTAEKIDGTARLTPIAETGTRETVQTIATPGNGKRIAGIRHFPASSGESATQCLITLIDDKTDRLMQTRKLAS